MISQAEAYTRGQKVAIAFFEIPWNRSGDRMKALIEQVDGLDADSRSAIGVMALNILADHLRVSIEVMNLYEGAGQEFERLYGELTQRQIQQATNDAFEEMMKNFGFDDQAGGNVGGI